ncbi:MAG: Maf family nucleotide pyrophosphatase [Tannerella sp.]|jgi:septum formation protein|nr:Maf family nucleotide pyrophosphatase [Tannerella sp.]
MNCKIILASNSPRRRELLKGLDIDFEVRVIHGINETYPHDIPVHDIPRYLANLKADAYVKEGISDDELIITADTAVLIDGLLLEKPANRQQAIEMLKTLSGRKHTVITAVTMTTKEKRNDFSVASTVHFDTLSEDEIIRYVNKYQPFDKAGAYGIQEWIGYIGVKGIEGSFYNVMGLPVQRLYRELQKNFIT